MGFCQTEPHGHARSSEQTRGVGMDSSASGMVS